MSATTTAVQPYLFFDGRCEEALDFYRRALGAEVTSILRWKDCPDPPPPGMIPEGSGDKVMHASFTVRGTTLLASDGDCGGTPQFKGISLTLNAPGVAEADRAFAALADGGLVQMPMGRTFFSPHFGMVQDRFGVSWMIIVEG
jgi:PhnB protein